MIYAAILAGGVGSRMKVGNLPKQFLMLGDAPVFVHTVQKFLMVPEIDQVILGVHPNWIGHAQEVLAQHRCADRVHVVAGGEDRTDTIKAIIDAVLKFENIELADKNSATLEALEGKIGDDVIILTHDSVRPFVSSRVIRDNIEAARNFGACDTVIPATDTIVAAQDGEIISDIPPRTEMYQGQTPQSFQLKQLIAAYAGLSEEEAHSLTDACKAFVLRGMPVKIVEGDATNIKLTTEMDYRIAQALIGRLDKIDAGSQKDQL